MLMSTILFTPIFGTRDLAFEDNDNVARKEISSTFKKVLRKKKEREILFHTLPLII